MKYTISRSDEVIENYKNSGSKFPYASAFGYCWAMLTDEQRLEVIERSKEKKENN